MILLIKQPQLSSLFTLTGGDEGIIQVSQIEKLNFWNSNENFPLRSADCQSCSRQVMQGEPVLLWQAVAGCLKDSRPPCRMQTHCKIIFPLPGMALNSNEGGTETWRYRRLINTHTHMHTSSLPLHIPNHPPSNSLIYFEYRPSNVLILRFQLRGWEVNYGGLSKWKWLHSSQLRRALQCHYARKEHHFDPWPGSSPLRLSLSPWENSVFMMTSRWVLQS